VNLVTLWHIFLAFFIPGVLGYGGGPSSIPLVENEVIKAYHWMDIGEFSKILALGNALPGPIATKMAGYIGYDIGGIPGVIVALIATIVPSLVLMIVLLNLLYKYKDSPKIKRLTILIRPVIAVLLGEMAYSFFKNAYDSTGLIETAAISLVSFVLLEKLKVHPAFVVIAALGYGAIFMAT
jgi:chromate transporter